MANNLIVGYTHQDESRGADRQRSSRSSTSWRAAPVYTSFGSEPFTPNNELRYNTFQVQDNFTKFRGNHTLDLRRQRREVPLGQLVLPRHAERLRLQLAGRLLHRRERLPGESEPDDVAGDAAPLPGALHQHPGPGRSRCSRSTSGTPAPTRRTSGGRAEPDGDRRPPRRRAVVRQHRLRQPDADALTFRDENGSPVQYNSGKLPDANVLWSPRVGFNWDVTRRPARRRCAAARASSPASRPTSGSRTRSATPAC